MIAKILNTVNGVAGSLLPAKLRRAILDCPGVLKLNESLFGGLQRQTVTPEGSVLMFNPLFHGQLSTTGKITNYEPEVRKVMCRLIKPGMVAYDVGANIGVFTLLMSQLVGDSGKVYAFEPERINYKKLQNTISVNHIENVDVVTVALGESTKSLLFDRRGGSFSGKVIDCDTVYKSTRNIVPMAIMSVDDIVITGNSKVPDFIKIDVEGYEGKVILGMREVLSRYAPIILCEIHEHLLDPWQVVSETLTASKYSIFRLEDFLAGNRSNLQSLEGADKIIAIKNGG